MTLYSFAANAIMGGVAGVGSSVGDGIGLGAAAVMTTGLIVLVLDSILHIPSPIGMRRGQLR